MMWGPHILIAALLLPTTVLAQDTPLSRPMLAVMPFDNHTKRRSAGIDVADMFIKGLFASDRYTVIHPVEAIKRLMDHTRGCVGVDEREAAQRIGKSLGCDVILVGSVDTAVADVPGRDRPEGQRGALYEVSARLMDVGSAKTLWLSHYTVRSLGRDPTFNQLKTAVDELTASLTQKFPGQPPAGESE